MPAVMTLGGPAHAAPATNGRIAYAPSTGDHPPGDTLSTAKADGSGKETFDASTSNDLPYPAWSTNGTYLAYVADSNGDYRDGLKLQIYTSRADGTDRVQITELSDGADISSPSWSPDGRRIAYALSNRNASDPRRSAVRIVDVTTGADVAVGGGKYDGSPSWSPDGSRIAFAGGEGAEREIYTMTVTGTDRRRLTQDQDLDDDPDWSPDGQRLVWSSDVETYSGAEIWTMTRDGKDATRLTNDAVADFGPVYSPDGARIAFWSGCRSYDGLCEDKDVWTIAAAGGAPSFVDWGVTPTWGRVPDAVTPSGDVPPGGALSSNGGAAGASPALDAPAFGTLLPTGPAPVESGAVQGVKASSRLRRARARRAAKDALRRRFGLHFTRRQALGLRCARRSFTTVACRASWSSGKRRYAGKVVVRLRASGVKTSVNVGQRT